LIIAGTIVSNRYVIVRLIGEGGMGAVYEARHINLGKRVAIKFLSKEFARDTGSVERFHQEAQIAGTLGHLNICEVSDFGMTDDGLPFLVMEYLEGESLSSILQREKKLPPDVASGIMKQVLGALEEVHGRGIIHRDLKPDNVFITNIKGHGLIVKLLDFGISKILKPKDPSLRLTRTGTMIGTPYYMSPEQVRASKNIDHRTDLFSCGVIFYEMVTGRVPYGGESFNEVLTRILEEPFPDPRKIVPDLEGGLVKILERSMAKNPSKRFESAGRFRAEIEHLSFPPQDGKAAGIP
jgi:serine/threonine protein kinase